MRTFKFRVFDKRTSKMYFVSNEFYLVFGTVPSKWALYSGDSVICNSDEGILMEFIGLKDVKGIDIYEGDILRHDYKNDRKEWSYTEAVVSYEDNDYDYGGRCLGFDINGFWGKSFYVIGNIHQNPTND